MIALPWNALRTPRIAVVTLMRKESKRFPGKNLYPFLGKPLYMHTVDFALGLDYPYHVIHNYDKLELPAKVIQHRKTIEWCDTGNEIAQHVPGFDIYLLLQVTSPRRIESAVWLALQYAKRAKCVYSARLIEDAIVYMEDEPVNFTMAQRTYEYCPKCSLIVETGSFYAFQAEQLAKHHIMAGSAKDRCHVLDAYGIDINTLEDLQEAERKLSK